MVSQYRHHSETVRNMADHVDQVDQVDQVYIQSAVLEFYFSDNEEVLDRINESIEEVDHLKDTVTLHNICSI